MRVNCREQIANPAEPVNGQDERRKCAAVDSPARLCCSVIKRATAQDAAALCHYSERGIFHDRTRKVSRTYPASCFSFCFWGTDCSTLDFFGGERVAVRSFSSSNFSFGCFLLMLLRLRNFGKAGRKDAVEFKVFREVIDERQNDVAEEQQPFALAGMGHIGKLVGRNVQLLCQDLSVSVGLIEHTQDFLYISCSALETPP